MKDPDRTKQPEVRNLDQAHLCINSETDPQGEYFSVPGGELALYSRKMPGKATENEDCAGIYPLLDNSCVIAVADGMGGMPHGGVASKITIEQLAAGLKAASQSESGYRAIVLDAIEAANTQISELGVGAGSTIAAVLIAGHSVRTFHAGDTEILLVGQRGKIKGQSISHSPVGYAVEAGMLDEEEARYHHERHLLSNFLGSQEMRIELSPEISLSRKDTLLVASDGLFDNLHLKELVDIIRKGDLYSVLQQLIHTLTHRMDSGDGSGLSKPDDVAIILYRRTL